MKNRLISILFLSFIALSSILFFILAVIIWFFTFPFDRRLVLLHLYSSLWASVYLWLMPAWSVSIQGRSNYRRKTTYIIVSNHQSQLDILVAFSLFLPFKWVSKAEIFRIPLIGWNMVLNRYIKLKRGNKESTKKMMDDCEKRIAEGRSVYFFPEGTRSENGIIKPFKTGALAGDIINADAIIVMSHFKGHEISGFGGAIKNLSMGCASRQGKLDMHSQTKPVVKQGVCTACGQCVSGCQVSAIEIKEKAFSWVLKSGNANKLSASIIPTKPKLPMSQALAIIWVPIRISIFPSEKPFQSFSWLVEDFLIEEESARATREFGNIFSISDWIFSVPSPKFLNSIGLLKWVQDDCALDISDRGFGKFPKLPAHCIDNNNPSIITKKAFATEENDSISASSAPSVGNRFAFKSFFRGRKMRTVRPAEK